MKSISILMFPPDNKIREYICFVCGKPFNDFMEMQKHISEKHEEGREYLVCPRCKYFIRDLSSHYKAKHVGTPMPKNCQLRPTILYDIVGKNKRKKIPSFKTGFFVSAKNGGVSLHFRSSLEEQVYFCLEKMGEILSYKVEPFGIEYWYKSKLSHYFPDILVQFCDGRVELWEVKPQKQQGLPMNIKKWEAAEHYCEMRGWKFEVINETKIELLKKKTR